MWLAMWRWSASLLMCAVLRSGALGSQAYRAERAARVAGSTVEPVSLPGLVCITCETGCDAGELAELLAQVKKSFETYRRVVTDGGLFCAFGAGSPHGICCGSSFFDYDDRFDEDVLVGEYDGATRHNVRREVAIPELVDEASADGGDSLEVAVARMREFNGRRYDGVLDEDPARHVNTFWYGLKSSASIARPLCVWMSVPGLLYR